MRKAGPAKRRKAAFEAVVAALAFAGGTSGVCGSDRAPDANEETGIPHPRVVLAAPAASPPLPAFNPGPAGSPEGGVPMIDHAGALGSPLIEGQAVEPIDMAAALRLAGARDLDIAIAREKICQAIAEWQQARVLWLPSLYIGPNWIRHDGQAQRVEGPVQSISKSSLFLGATAAAGSSVSGPVPAGGPAQVSGLSTILRVSDAIFTPLAARQVVEARKAGLQTATNDALLEVAEAYFDLVYASGRLAIAREATANAETLADLTGSYARSGKGLMADYHRSMTERDRRRKNVEEFVGELEIRSAEMVRLLHLDPRLVIAPLEPPEALFRLVDDQLPLDDLIPIGLRNRPELAEAQALVNATLVRLRQARLRPFIPSLAFRVSGGGFGGGTNAFFGNFASRSDTDVNLFWEVQNLGLADRAIAQGQAARQRQAVLEQFKVQDRVAAEVVAAHKGRLAAARQVNEAGRALPEAIRSYQLNLARIQQAAGLPIEVLQPIQALAQARTDFLDAAVAYNRAQFRLFRALGQPALCIPPPVTSSPPTAPTTPLPRPSSTPPPFAPTDAGTADSPASQPPAPAVR